MKYSTTLVLAAIVVLAAALLYAFRDRLTGEVPAPPEPARTFALIEDASADDVETLTLLARSQGDRMTEHLVLVRKDGTWRLAKPVDYPADDWQARSLARAAVEAKYRQAIEPGAPDAPSLAALGLEEPAFRVILSVKATGEQPARTITIDVGNKSAFGNHLYVRTDRPAKTVVLESADLLEEARKPVGEYRRRKLMDLARGDVVRIDLERKESRVRIQRAEEGADRWVLSEPLTARADGDVVSGLLGSALGVRAAEFIDDAPKDLARYGLDEPRLSVTLWKKAPEPEKAEQPPEGEGDPAGDEKPEARPEPVKAVTLKFGSWADVKDETAHVTTDDACVVSADAETFKDLDKSAADIRDQRVLAVRKDQAKRIHLKTEAGELELAKVDDVWRLTVPGRPEMPADSDSVDGLLEEAAGLKVVYFLADLKEELPQGFGEPQTELRIQLEGEAAPRGMDVGGTAESRTLVRNVREDWIGRVNETNLDWTNKEWLAYRNKQILAFDAKRATRLTVQTPDRTLILEKSEDTWRLIRPIEAEPRESFVPGLLKQLENLVCESFVAATSDFKSYGLETGQVLCTVTLGPPEEGAKPEEKVLHLTVQDDGSVLGRLQGGDLVFKAPDRLLSDVAAEPLAPTLTDVVSYDIDRLEIAAGEARMRLAKEDGKWQRVDESGQTVGEADAAGDLAPAGLATAVARLVAARWAAYDAKDLKQFGLEEPAFRITFAAKEETVTLLVSDTRVPENVADLIEGKPLRYAMVEGGKRVAILAGRDLKSILDATESLKKAAEKESP